MLFLKKDLAIKKRQFGVVPLPPHSGQQNIDCSEAAPPPVGEANLKFAIKKAPQCKPERCHNNRRGSDIYSVLGIALAYNNL